jgi:hypothetical protein
VFILRRIFLVDFFVQEEGKGPETQEISTHLKRRATSSKQEFGTPTLFCFQVLIYRKIQA